MVETEELIAELESQGYTHIRHVEGLGLCALMRFIYTTGLCVGVDDGGYVGRYCYSNHADAKEALNGIKVDTDPVGPWIKYKGRGGERSNPDQSQNG